MNLNPRQFGPKETEGALTDIEQHERYAEGEGKAYLDPEGNVQPSGSISESEFQASRPSLSASVTDPELKSLHAAASETGMSHRGVGFIADTAALLQRAKLWESEGKKRQTHVNRLKKKGMGHEEAVASMLQHWQESGKSAKFQSRLDALK